MGGQHGDNTQCRTTITMLLLVPYIRCLIVYKDWSELKVGLVSTGVLSDLSDQLKLVGKLELD